MIFPEELILEIFFNMIVLEIFFNNTFFSFTNKIIFINFTNNTPVGYCFPISVFQTRLIQLVKIRWTNLYDIANQKHIRKN
jgi:hypothetical protein